MANIIQTVPGLRNFPTSPIDFSKQVGTGLKNCVYNITVGPVLLVGGVSAVIISKAATAARHPIETTQALIHNVGSVCLDPSRVIKQLGSSFVDAIVITTKEYYTRFDKKPVEVLTEVAATAYLGPKIKAAGNFLKEAIEEQLSEWAFQIKYNKEIMKFISEVIENVENQDSPTINIKIREFLAWIDKNRSQLRKASEGWGYYVYHIDPANYVYEWCRSYQYLERLCKDNILYACFHTLIQIKDDLQKCLLNITSQQLAIQALKPMAFFMEASPAFLPFMWYANARDQLEHETPPINRDERAEDHHASDSQQQEKLEMDVRKTTAHLERLSAQAASQHGKHKRAKAIAARLQYMVHSEILKNKLLKLATLN